MRQRMSTVDPLLVNRVKLDRCEKKAAGRRKTLHPELTLRRQRRNGPRSDIILCSGGRIVVQGLPHMRVRARWSESCALPVSRRRWSTTRKWDRAGSGHARREKGERNIFRIKAHARGQSMPLCCMCTGATTARVQHSAPRVVTRPWRAGRRAAQPARRHCA